MKKLKIAYVTTYDASDVNNWSGTGYYISKTLEKIAGKIEYIGGLNFKPTITTNINNTIHNRFYKKSYQWERSEIAGKQFSKQISDKLRNKDIDIIFSPGTIPIAYLDTKVPIVFWTDATFASMLNYYITDFSKKSIQESEKLEYEALKRCKYAIYSSEWAANSAIQNYGINPNKVKVIPFGANIDRIPLKNETIKPLNKPLNLLFIGKGWERKGGTIALETISELSRMGVDVSLNLVGSKPPSGITLPKNVKVYEFLDKNNKVDSEILYNLFKNADLFLLPTRKECYGIVFCEANSFGIPVITTNTGGIPTIVQDGMNGYKLSLNASGTDFANKIKEIIDKPDHYIKLQMQSRKRYEEILNWDSAGLALIKLLEEAI